jgi:glycosyltransferase involved in cell wall biosynthesis
VSESLDRARSRPRRPCVVMMAGNDILPDVRVLKYAHTVAKLGPEVVAVGIGGPRLTGERIVGDVRIVCPAVSERAAASGWRFRLSAAKPWFTDATTYRRSLARWEYASREVAGLPGRATRDAKRHGVTKNTATSSTASRLYRSLRTRSLGFRRRILALRARPLRWARNTASSGTGGGRAWRIRAYRRLGLASWRATMPELLDAELTLGPILDELAPDVIHVHDVYLLGVGARAAHRAALDGRRVSLVYDAHEYVRGTAAVAARRVAAYEDLESEFIGDADRVITVSEPLATLLRRDYRLSQLPDVVLNAPVDVPEHASVKGVRDLVGLTTDVPLLVYGGGVNRARGVDTIVKALPLVPEAHLVVVSRGNSVVMDLQKLAATLGVGDRLHIVPYVEADLVPMYLESATVGVSSLLRAPNHDIAVTNKFCEYLAAGLPIVTSDTPAQATLVRDLGLGAVYTAGDPRSLAAALHNVLPEAESLRERITGDAALRFRFSWPAQAEVVRTVYDELLAGLPDEAWRDDALHLTGSLGAR